MVVLRSMVVDMEINNNTSGKKGVLYRLIRTLYVVSVILAFLYMIVEAKEWAGPGYGGPVIWSDFWIALCVGFGGCS